MNVNALTACGLCLVLFGPIGLGYAQPEAAPAKIVEPWSIPGVAGISVEGVLQLPEAESPVPAVVFVHGSGAVDRDGNAPPRSQPGYFRMLADSLLNRGIGVIRYDKRNTRAPAMEQLEGLKFRHLIDDIDSVMGHFAKDDRIESIFALGHSQGALLVTLADLSDVRGVLAVCGTSQPIDRTLLRQVCARDSLSCSQTRQMVEQARRPVDSTLPVLQRTNLRFMGAWMQFDPLLEASKVTLPVLVVGAEKDLQVPVKEALELHAAFPRSELYVDQDMNHVLKVVRTEGENTASYLLPGYPLSMGFVEAVVQFVRKHQ